MVENYLREPEKYELEYLKMKLMVLWNKNIKAFLDMKVRDIKKFTQDYWKRKIVKFFN